MRRSRLSLAVIALVSAVVSGLASPDAAAQTPKRIYLANDDHTDYMWSADEATYRQAFIEMIDYYLGQADRTAGNAAPYQGRFSLDGTFWVWEYEHNKPLADLNRLMARIKDGHISVPLHPLVLAYGGMPAEAVLRSMYYGGQLERRYAFRIPIAASIENQTLPCGVAGLWAGAGARYSWKGVCGCATRIPTSTLSNRAQEIYWMTAPDGSRILMKWHSLDTNASMGGYAEARDPWAVVDQIDTPAFASRYPYGVIGAFGKGWDDLKTLTDDVISAAQAKTNASRQVLVSNQLDFFQDFETNHGTGIPSVSVSYGNEWDLYSASMSELSAGVKRSLEDLRAAEAMATLVSLKTASFLTGREAARDKAMLDLGLYFEHDWTADGPVTRNARRDWQRSIAGEIGSYVSTLLADSRTALGGLIARSGANPRFYAFNPLSWTRTDVAEVAYARTTPVHVVDLATGQQVPSQIVSVAGEQRLRILAPDVPSTGYKVFEIRAGAGQVWSDAAVTDGTIVENAFCRVTFSGRGAITSWVDKTRGDRELVQARSGYAVNDLGSGSGTVTIESAGPVSVTLVATTGTPLAHTTRLTLLRDSPRIVLENRITQNFGSTQSWRFSLSVPAPDIRHEEVGAILSARLTSQGGSYATTNARYDWLTLNHFADVTGSDAVGVTLSNADLYFMQAGNSTASTLDGATPLLKVLAGGQVDGSSLGIPNQGGDSSFLQRFALQSHGAYDAAGSMKFSLEHQNPLVTGTVTGGTSYPETSYSLLTISDPNTLLWALKPADDGIDHGVVVRMWNMSASSAAPVVRLVNDRIATASRMSHIETVEEAATLANGALVAALAGHQLRTYAITPSGIGPLARRGRDFDGDHRADVAVYRPATGTWFWLTSSSGNATVTDKGWGSAANADVPLRGDFDGDGVVDPAVYRPATGTWLILTSSSGYADWTSFGWGMSTDVPVPGDYDGDGVTDGAVYRPSSGAWYVRPSSGATPWSVVFGNTTDTPVPGDYDGDGRTDVAVYRASGGTWLILTSGSAYTHWYFRGWGAQAENDRPVPGDYDGDGRTDVAVYRPATGTWFILKSTANDLDWTWGGWGSASDEPMPADYDGDGRIDLAVYRPSTGAWWVKPSGGSTPWTAVFGQSGDLPLQGIR